MPVKQKAKVAITLVAYVVSLELNCVFGIVPFELCLLKNLTYLLSVRSDKRAVVSVCCSLIVLMPIFATDRFTLYPI